MAQKSILPVYPVFSAALANQTMAGVGVLSSPISNILYKDNICYQVQWTGNPVGIFTVQVSVDYNPGLPQSYGGEDNGMWVTVPAVDNFGNPPAAAGGPGVVNINITQIGAPYIQILYTNTSGAGTLSGYVFGKALGA